MEPTTYHLVWTTYGSWLPGDERGWVKERTLGVQPPDPEREQAARETMQGDAVVLDADQRELVERTIRDHSLRRGWTLHAINVRSNHVHVVVTADVAADVAMGQFKSWCSRRLSDAAGLTEPVGRKAGRRRWFTEGGHSKVIADDRYLENAVAYVADGQDRSQ